MSKATIHTGAIMLFSWIALAGAGEPPRTRKAPVEETYHGTIVTDEYRWLEDDDDPEVRGWSDAQNEYARGYLDKLPHVDAIRGQVTEILSAQSSSYGDVAYRGGRLLAIQRKPPKQQPFLVMIPSLQNTAAARVLVDPNQIDPEGTTAIDWYKVSPDGKLVAVSLSAGGSEQGNLRVYETESGRELPDAIPYVNSGTAGGSLAWNPAGDGFFYTRHLRVRPDDPADNIVYQHVYFHRLGASPDEDRYELGEGFPQIAEIQLVMDDRTGRLLATAQEGDGGEFAHFLRSADGDWRQFSRFGDGVKQAVFAPGAGLYVVSLKDAPRGKLLRVSADALDVDRAETVIDEGEDTIVTSGAAFWGEQTVLVTEHRLYVVYQLGGPSEVRVFDHDGRRLEGPEQLPVSAVHGLLRLEGDDILFGNVSYLEPDAYYKFDAHTGNTFKTAIADHAEVDLSDARVVRKFATSKDGTRVPVNIILPHGVHPDGDNPCVVNGYGGYGISLAPRYRPLTRVLLDQGVIYAVANLRGGGEYGEAWHQQGNLTRKQNVFDDFHAVLKYLIEEDYSTCDKLAIIGGSNGGLLMGATLVQHPGRAQAVVSSVGIYDMLRVELSPNGAFNVPEFGTVKDADQFRALYAYSPYHNVKDGCKYPAVLFITGANDPRVDPMQSRKMTARLQAANAAGTPILLRTSANAGHGADNSLTEQIEQAVDVHAFLFDQLGVKFQSPGRR